MDQTGRSTPSPFAETRLNLLLAFFPADAARAHRHLAREPRLRWDEERIFSQLPLYKGGKPIYGQALKLEFWFELSL